MALQFKLIDLPEAAHDRSQPALKCVHYLRKMEQFYWLEGLEAKLAAAIAHQANPHGPNGPLPTCFEFQSVCHVLKQHDWLWA